MGRPFSQVVSVVDGFDVCVFAYGQVRAARNRSEPFRTARPVF
jgi:hypothetical protein